MSESHLRSVRAPGAPARDPRTLLLVLFALAGASGCNTVEYHEKGALADPAMQFIESAAQLHWQQKVQFSDEGAAGGIGTSAGGGCGCY